jgi:hypothetical protein
VSSTPHQRFPRDPSRPIEAGHVTPPLRKLPPTLLSLSVGPP